MPVFPRKVPSQQPKQLYKTVTMSIGPTIKMGEAFFKANVSLTATGQSLDVEQMSKDLRRLYLVALRQEIKLSNTLEEMSVLGALDWIKEQLREG